MMARANRGRTKVGTSAGPAYPIIHRVSQCKLPTPLAEAGVDGSGSKASVSRRRRRDDRRWTARAVVKVTGRESRSSVNNAGVERVSIVRGEIHPVGADRVLGSAHLDGLALIERADGDLRLVEE